MYFNNIWKISSYFSSNKLEYGLLLNRVFLFIANCDWVEYFNNN